MARYNEILVGRYNRFLQKLFGLKGGPPAPQLSTDIGAIIPLWHGRETLLHQGWSRYASGLAVTGGVGQNAQVRLRNPTASGIVVVLERFLFDGEDVNGIFFLEHAALTTDGNTIVTAGVLDSRQKIGTGAAVFSSQVNGTVAGGNALIGRFITWAGVLTVYELIPREGDEIVILPGFAVQLTANSTNTGISCALAWRERPLEEGELVQ